MACITPNDTPAAAACFNTTELLEAILEKLPNKSLFQAMGVCRRFHDVVVGSFTLRQRLFLEPATLQECLESPSMRRELDGYLDVWKALDTPIPLADRAIRANYPLIANPLFFHANKFGRSGRSIMPSTLPMWKHGKLVKSSRLLRMYLCHPELAVIGFDIRCIKHGRKNRHLRLAGLGENVSTVCTLGEIMANVEDRVLRDFQGEVDWKGSCISTNLAAYRDLQRAPASWPEVFSSK